VMTLYRPDCLWLRSGAAHISSCHDLRPCPSRKS
jgi:hypothetical protein